MQNILFHLGMLIHDITCLNLPIEEDWIADMMAIDFNTGIGLLDYRGRGTKPAEEEKHEC